MLTAVPILARARGSEISSPRRKKQRSKKSDILSSKFVKKRFKGNALTGGGRKIKRIFDDLASEIGGANGGGVKGLAAKNGADQHGGEEVARSGIVSANVRRAVNALRRPVANVSANPIVIEMKPRNDRFRRRKFRNFSKKLI